MVENVKSLDLHILQNLLYSLFLYTNVFFQYLKCLEEVDISQKRSFVTVDIYYFKGKKDNKTKTKQFLPKENTKTMLMLSSNNSTTIRK